MTTKRVRKAPPPPNYEEVREWANLNGWDLGTRGRLPADVIEAWDRRHQARKFDVEQAHHGTVRGRTQGCHCGRCERRFAEYMVAFYSDRLAELSTAA